MQARLTAHSEFGRLESVMIKQAGSAFLSQAMIDTQWKNLNFTEAPDFNQAREEYSDFENFLKKFASEIHYLPASESVTIDSIYCRDAALSTDYGMILCNMGKPARENEPNAILAYCEETKIPILGQIQSPGTLEGGDVAWINEQTLAVGHTYRSNKEGIRQLRQLLSPYDVEVLEVDLPHYKGPKDVFHLMSIFSPVDRDLAVVYSPLMPISFRNRLLDLQYHLIEVPEIEFELMGCNVLAMAPRVCLMMAGNPETAASLRSSGCMVYEYAGAEISYKGGGGPTCLTRPLKRKIIDSGFY